MHWHNPISWTLPLLHLGRVRVHVHALFLAVALMAIGWSLTPASSATSLLGDPLATTVAMVSLLIVTVVREVGRAIAVNRFGGEADVVVLWPLGLFNDHREPVSRASRIVCTLLPTGISTIAATGLWAAVSRVIGNDAVLILNPLTAPDAYALWSVQGRPEFGLLLLWTVYIANLAVLLVNLLPSVPLDGSRLVEAIAVGISGRERGAKISGLTGLITGAAMVVVGVALSSMLLSATGCICAWLSWLRVQRARFPFIETPETSPASHMEPLTDPSPASEIDAVLARISKVGYENLSPEEKAILQRETDRRRGVS